MIALALAVAIQSQDADIARECTPTIEAHATIDQHVPSNHLPVTVLFDTIDRDECKLWNEGQLGAELPPGRWAVGLNTCYSESANGSRITAFTADGILISSSVPAAPDAQTCVSLNWEFEFNETTILRARVAQTARELLYLVNSPTSTRIQIRKVR